MNARSNVGLQTLLSEATVGRRNGVRLGGETSAVSTAQSILRSLEALDWRFEPDLPRIVDESVAVQSAEVVLYFATAPTAGSLAYSLENIDREARRLATAIGQDRPVEELYGRGTRLIERSKGLIVQDARAGSLEVTIGFGWLAAIVMSDPVSSAST